MSLQCSKQFSVQKNETENAEKNQRTEEDRDGGEGTKGGTKEEDGDTKEISIKKQKTFVSCILSQYQE